MSGTLYQAVEMLDVAKPRLRLLPLPAYPHLSEVLTVPILHIEMATLARHWPIVWVAHADGFDPVAVIGLHPRFGVASRLDALTGEALPLAIRAFPFLLGPATETGDAKIFIHTPPTDSEAAAGEAVFDGSGQLTPVALAKSDILWLFAAERAKTQAMTKALADAGGLGLWKLRYMFEDEAVANEGFHAVEAPFLQDERYVSLARDHGPAFVSMVESHILSKPRIQDLADLLSTTPAAGQSEAD